jgi:hypothetical protein
LSITIIMMGNWGEPHLSGISCYKNELPVEIHATK